MKEPVVNCQRCGAGVPILNLSAELKKDISDTAKRLGRMQAILKLKDLAELGLGEAKAVAYHLGDDDAKCHRCHQQLCDENKEVVCPKCRALNLRW